MDLYFIQMSNFILQSAIKKQKEDEVKKQIEDLLLKINMDGGTNPAEEKICKELANQQ